MSPSLSAPLDVGRLDLRSRSAVHTRSGSKIFNPHALAHPNFRVGTPSFSHSNALSTSRSVEQRLFPFVARTQTRDALKRIMTDVISMYNPEISQYLRRYGWFFRRRCKQGGLMETQGCLTVNQIVLTYVVSNNYAPSIPRKRRLVELPDRRCRRCCFPWLQYAGMAGKYDRARAGWTAEPSLFSRRSGGFARQPSISTSL